jgi:hypothetical protein
MKRRLVVIASGNGSTCRAGISTSYEIVMVSYAWTKKKKRRFPCLLSSNPSPERIDESVSGKSPPEKSILLLSEIATILE